ncbi:MAG TPA: DinB family protein [Fimbriimonadaceae bacterium]|nr:DinB family protein [Fimbriimonadaceae bacterium]
MDEGEVRRQLAIGFEYSYTHDDWVTPLEAVLDGIDAATALRRPPPADKGIWDIVLHLAVWHEDIVIRVRTGQQSHPSEGAWPPPPDEPDPAAWEAAKTRLRAALVSVQRMIETTPLEQIMASPYSLGDLLCRFTHNGYHLGQITKLREMLGLAGA